MPIYEFTCYGCDNNAVIERHLYASQIDDQWCEFCGAQLKLIPSVPARVTPGTYGKAGGLPPRTEQ